MTEASCLSSSYITEGIFLQITNFVFVFFLILKFLVTNVLFQMTGCIHIFLHCKSIYCKWHVRLLVKYILNIFLAPSISMFSMHNQAVRLHKVSLKRINLKQNCAGCPLAGTPTFYSGDIANLKITLVRRIGL